MNKIITTLDVSAGSLMPEQLIWRKKSSSVIWKIRKHLLQIIDILHEAMEIIIENSENLVFSSYVLNTLKHPNLQAIVKIA
jgi:hypothetical protein